MKLWKRLGIVLCCLALILGAIWFCFGERLSLLYRSLQSFKDENLAYTFQHTPEIQPTVTIQGSAAPFEFAKEENIALADGFQFEGPPSPSCRTPKPLPCW